MKTLEIPINGEIDIINARLQVRELLIKFENICSISTRIDILTIVSELSRNIYKYASNGKIIVELTTEEARIGIKMTFIDNGPGIPDIEAAMQPKAKEKYQKAVVLIQLLQSEQKISDEIFYLFGKGYDTYIYPVLSKLGELSSWIDEHNPLSKKALEIIERSDWEPLKAFLAIRNKFLEVRNLFLVKFPAKIEEGRKLREERIEQARKNLEQDPTNIMVVMDKVISFFNQISQKAANTEELARLFKDFIDRLRRCAKENEALNQDLFSSIIEVLKDYASKGMSAEGLIEKGQGLINQAKSNIS